MLFFPTIFRRSTRPVFVAAILAAIFSTLIMLPSMLQWQDSLYPFQGIHILGADAEVYYAARVQEVYDGFTSVGSPFYSEPKDLPYLQPPFPEFIIASMGKALSLNSVSAFILAKIILSAGAFLAMSLFLFSVTRQAWVSILASFASLTAGALLSAPWDLVPFITGYNFEYEFLRFTRLLHPQWTTTFFLLTLTCFAEWIRAGKVRYMILAAILTASLVYAYVYAWSYLFAVAGLLVLWFLWKRDRKRLLGLMIFWTITIVLVIPYGMHMYALLQHPWYTETSMRSGMVLRHGPLLLGVWVAFFVGLGLASRRLWPVSWPLLPLVAISGVVAINQQLITGLSIVPHHYNWYYIQPMASTFFLAFILSSIFSKVHFAWARITLSVLLVVASLMCGIIQQVGSYHDARRLWGRLQGTAPTIQYINDHLGTGDVVYSTDMAVLNLVPVFTSADVYTSTNANLGLVPIERARFTYFFDLWLQGVTPEDAEQEFLTIRRFDLSSRLHAIYYREAAGDFRSIPEEEVIENIFLYRAFMNMPLAQKLTTYPVRAVVTTPNDPENSQWSLLLSCTKESFALQGYSVRLMIPEGDTGSCL